VGAKNKAPDSFIFQSTSDKPGGRIEKKRKKKEETRGAEPHLQ